MDNMNGDTCAVKIKRKQGGQPGNQNARIHGFYSKTLDAEEKRDYEEARDIEGLGEEIALLRAKINSIMRHAPDNHKLFLLALSTLSRLFITQNKIAKGDRSKFKEGLAKILKNAAPPAGFELGKILDQ